MTMKLVNGKYVDDTALMAGQYSNQAPVNTGLVMGGQSYTMPSIDYGRNTMNMAPAPVVLPQNKTSTTKPAVAKTNPTVIPQETVVTTPPIVPTPRAPIGSVASLYTPEEQRMMDRLNAQNKSDAFGTIDPKSIYKKTLASYQSQIDAINNIYNDQLNQSRITNAPTYQARLDQNRLEQLQGGFGTSAMGAAQTNAVSTANNKEQAAAEAIINDRRAVAIANIYGQARKSSEEELSRKYEAQKAGASAVLKELNERPERRKAALSATVKKALALGYDLTTMSPKELDSLAKELKVNPDDIMAEYESQFSEAQAASEAAELKKKKAEADLAKTLAETGQIGKMTPYQAAQLGISQAHLKIAQDRAKQEQETSTSNYDESSIPQDIKISLAEDLSANAEADGDQKKTLVDFFAAYPEVKTEYLMKLYSNYDVTEQTVE